MKRRGLLGAVVVAGVLMTGASAAAPLKQDGDSAPPVAVVGKTRISREEFLANVHARARQRFFHGRVSEKKMTALRGEVINEMVDRVLLVAEAKRRGLRARGKTVEKEIAQYEQRYRDRPAWQENRQRWLTQLRVQLEEEDILEQLETRVRAVKPPTVDQVRAYYTVHPDKFTTPERLEVSVILLKVEPSAPVEKWRAAEREAQDLVRRLKDGADFAELARLHSGDGSAEQGGDLGFVHKGMLADEAQQALDGLDAGSVTAPVHLLQGIALFKLRARVAPARLTFEQSRKRAAELLEHDLRDEAWTALRKRLRNQTDIRLDKRYIAGSEVADSTE